MSTLISPQAEADLDQIWGYSYTHWGEAQADKYYGQIVQAIHGLDERRALARQLWSKPEFYRLSVQKHFLIFKNQGADVLIVRALHHSQDTERHL